LVIAYEWENRARINCCAVCRITEEDLKEYFLPDESGQSLEDLVEMLNSISQEVLISGHLLPISLTEKHWREMATVGQVLPQI